MCARRRISDNAIVAATADRAVPLLFGASVRDGATPRQTSGRPRSPTATAPARSPSAFVRRSSTIDARGSVLACAPATSVPRCGAEDGLDGVVRPGPVRGGAADDEDFALFGHVGSGSCRGRVTVHVRITSWPFGVRGPSERLWPGTWEGRPPRGPRWSPLTPSWSWARVIAAAMAVAKGRCADDASGAVVAGGRRQR
jgi:hypothetical protein